MMGTNCVRLAWVRWLSSLVLLGPNCKRILSTRISIFSKLAEEDKVVFVIKFTPEPGFKVKLTGRASKEIVLGDQLIWVVHLGQFLIVRKTSEGYEQHVQFNSPVEVVAEERDAVAKQLAKKVRAETDFVFPAYHAVNP
jgi:hypothetical protein